MLTHTGILTRFDAKNGEQTYKARIGTGGDFGIALGLQRRDFLFE